MDGDKGQLNLEKIAREQLGDVKAGLVTPRLYEEIVRNREGHLSHLGPIVVRTGHWARRAPQDTFVVQSDDEERRWLGDGCRLMDQAVFDRLLARVLSFMQNRDIYVQDCIAAPGSSTPLPLRVATETAWHSLYARDLLWPRTGTEEVPREPAFTLVHAPSFHGVPDQDGAGTSAFVVIAPAHRVALVAGSAYAGEIRQAVGALCRYLHASEPLLPFRGAVVETAETGPAAFLGRTANGKTALALDPTFRLVGDHDHGWDAEGIFAYERGCYARVSDLNEEEAPELHGCARRFGTILENVALSSRSRRVALSGERVEENARAAFPSSHLSTAVREGRTGHPRNVFLLTRDTTGVLPPIARLTADQAVFAFLTSYAASLGETEATPGDVRPRLEEDLRPASDTMVGPGEYAKRFGRKVVEQGARCWLMNTGWVGEPEGRGDRLPLTTSRALAHAAISGALDDVPVEKDPLFLFEVPKECPGVAPETLDPRRMAADEGDYEVRATRLALEFIKGFGRFEAEMPESVREMVAAVPIDHESPDLLEQLMFSI